MVCCLPSHSIDDLWLPVWLDWTDLLNFQTCASQSLQVSLVIWWGIGCCKMEGTRKISDSNGTSLSPKTGSWICPCWDQVEARLPGSLWEIPLQDDVTLCVKPITQYPEPNAMLRISGFNHLPDRWNAGFCLRPHACPSHRFGLHLNLKSDLWDWDTRPMQPIHANALFELRKPQKQCKDLAVLLGSWVAAYLKHITSTAENTNLRPLQEFAQWPSANGRCTSTSFVSVVGSSVFFVAEARFFFGTAVHVLNSLQSRLPPIDVDSEQADLPEVLVAIQRLGSCKVSWTESVLNKDATWLHSYDSCIRRYSQCL